MSELSQTVKTANFGQTASFVAVLSIIFYVTSHQIIGPTLGMTLMLFASVVGYLNLRDLIELHNFYPLYLERKIEIIVANARKLMFVLLAAFSIFSFLLDSTWFLSGRISLYQLDALKGMKLLSVAIVLLLSWEFYLMKQKVKQKVPAKNEVIVKQEIVEGTINGSTS